jgi:hypothetical protein
MGDIKKHFGRGGKTFRKRGKRHMGSGKVQRGIQEETKRKDVQKVQKGIQ